MATALLDATLTGLTTAEVDSRRNQGQGNDARLASSRTWLDIVRGNLFTFINIALFVIGGILIALGQPRDALMSSGLALVNAIAGIIQEAIAKRRLDQIALLTRPTAHVLRDGVMLAVDPAELVRGDLLVARAGDQIMLDGTIRSGSANLDESLLTGEADPIAKRVGDSVVAGAFCVSGQIIYEAESVGVNTIAGAMTEGARAYTTSLTPLQRDVNTIVRVLLIIAGFLLILELAGAWIWEVPLHETVVGAAVILGIVPSGLFLMITVSYSMGAIRLASQEALVQQVNAVESLSNVTVFCADKTGTLTTNRLAVAALQPVEVDERTLGQMLGIFAANVSAHNKTSEAIALTCPGGPQAVVAEAPFSSERKWSAVAVDSGEPCGVFVLGAPEMLLPKLQGAESLAPPQDWFAQGWRILVFAHSPSLTCLPSAEEDALPPDLRAVGWIALSDELRPNLDKTLERFRKANVRLKIISGDHPETVLALARQAGFPAEAMLISGIDLKEMSDAEFASAAEEGDIFGRITPDQKQRLVKAMRDHRHYVAMTGDGVNDVLSVKAANLGIAMQSGSQATRAVADIILLNDSFAAVPVAFAEGQRIRRGLMDILDLFLVRVFVVALLILSIMFIGGGFPFEPADMTLLTLLTVGIPTFALAYWAPVGRAPRRIFHPLLTFVFPATTLLLILALSVYFGFYLIHDVDMGALRAGEVGGLSRLIQDEGVARDALTYVMVLSGLVLVLFVAPPNAWWAVVEPTEHDWRPAAVAVAMAPLYVLILMLPATRDLFEVEHLSALQYVVLALAVLLWTLALREVWKRRIFERLFGYG